VQLLPSHGSSQVEIRGLRRSDSEEHLRMKISDTGLDFIKQFEAFVPFVYDDFNPKKEWKGGAPQGTLTIGYGHTKAAAAKVDMKVGARVTEPEALAILRADLAPEEAAVDAAIKVDLTQHQFDALVSFRFNTGRMKGTGLCNRVNEKAFDKVPAEFRKWVKSKGVVMKGLKNRRQGEIDLWNKK
jgi:GH24 family phage-related lysozyme (muramidase)